MIEKINSQENLKQNLELKILSNTNAADYFNLIDENRKYFGNFNNLNQNKYQNIQEVQETFKNSSKVRYGIYNQDSDLIDTINLREINAAGKDDKIAEIGYLVAEKYAGQGVATNALQLLIQKINGKYNHLIADAHIDNIASQKVLEKSGFAKKYKDDDRYYYKKELQ